MDDPDAKKVVGKTWVHWILSDIPPNTKYLDEVKFGKLGIGVAGKNSDRSKKYFGPCPPKNEHKYNIKAYSLKTKLEKSLKALTQEKFEKLYAANCKNESVVKEGAEDEAQLVMASKDMVDKVTGWMEDTASMQTETILELGDAIRDEEGSEKSESFINAVKPALESLYTSLEATREALTGGVAVLTGENAPDTMGADAEEPAMEPTTDADADMPDQSDDFAASEPASGGEEPADREKREHIIRLSRRLAETLSKKKA